jgi:hypothetical protein
MGLIASKKIYLLAEVKCAKFNTNAINEVPFASKMKIDAETSSA